MTPTNALSRKHQDAVISRTPRKHIEHYLLTTFRTQYVRTVFLHDLMSDEVSIS